MNAINKTPRPQVQTLEIIDKVKQLREELLGYLNQLDETNTLFSRWLVPNIDIEIEDLLEVVHFYTVLSENFKRELWMLKSKLNDISPYINMARVDARRQEVQE